MSTKSQSSVNASPKAAPSAAFQVRCRCARTVANVLVTSGVVSSLVVAAPVNDMLLSFLNLT